MRYLITVIFVFQTVFCCAQLWTRTSLANLPEPVSNNAVSEGIVNGEHYLYSFGGIDSTRSSGGIHLKSFRYHLNSDIWETIPSLPDTMGKVAMGANRVMDTIYIFGGYHVMPDGNEFSSNKVHRYVTSTNTYISDGANIPVPIDDHVQFVWRDSLIFLITGWSGDDQSWGNVPDVQIYNPYFNTWTTGTPVANDNYYKAFGASGSVLSDTIYYFGGASTGFNYPAQRFIRKGIINPTDPSDITWSQFDFDPSVKGYRTASTTFFDEYIYWIGGSDVTYNYNGVAYNGSGPVFPTNRSLYYNPSTGTFGEQIIDLPLDLRGIAKVNNSDQYLIGGFNDAITVSNELIKLSNDLPNTIPSTNNLQSNRLLYPNPSKGIIYLSQKSGKFILIDLSGQIIKKGQFNNGLIDIQGQKTGCYILEIEVNSEHFRELIIVK